MKNLDYLIDDEYIMCNKIYNIDLNDLFTPKFEYLKYRLHDGRISGHLVEDSHCAGNAWFIPYKTIVSKDARGKHPASFPEELVERCIKFSGVSSGTLLDPFMGTGTSGVVGVRCGLDVIGYDISEDYCSFARSRISKEIGLDKFFL